MDLPREFIIRTRQLSENDYPALEASLQNEPPVSIRINPAKHYGFMPYEKVQWCETGYYLTKRPQFTFDPLFHAGIYYVQEASSMFIEQVINHYLHNPVTCLDLCASPGGKSTHLLSKLPVKSLLVSNEIIHSRSVVLAENVIKWGSSFSMVTNNTPKEIGATSHLFDVILADLPCSGEGMFRKDINSRKEWSIANVRLCAARQRGIINDIWNSLKPGGLLIYSTCTFNFEENEENIKYISETFGAEVLPVPTEDKWNISNAIRGDFPVYRFFPHRQKGEGFFLAILRKPEDKQIRYSPGKKQIRNEKTIIPQNVREWIINDKEYQLIVDSGILRAIPNDHLYTYYLLKNRLRVISAGITLGEIKGKDVVPFTGLAMNTIFDRSAFPIVELSWEDAVRFLQKESLKLSGDIPKDFVTINYLGQPLGFVKNIGNRANNLYPQQWKIRSGHAPKTIPVIITL